MGMTLGGNTLQNDKGYSQQHSTDTPASTTYRYEVGCSAIAQFAHAAGVQPLTDR